MNAISAVIITFNEEKNIAECLNSLKSFCSEIVVVDSGSSDNTVEICKQYTDKVYIADWPGFGPQKNRALDYATNEWVLSIDADEVVSEKLKNEIVKLLNDNQFAAYQIPRLSKYCGKFLYNGGWWPDYVTRLFQKSKYSFTNDKVHERVDIKKDEIGTLSNHLIHNRDDSLEATLNRMNKYSTLWAEENQEKKKGGLLKAFTHSFWTFVRIYLIRKGFLDGKEGLLMAISNSCGSFYKYIKLYYLQRTKKD